MPDRLARLLVERAMELHRRRLWTKAPADAPFLVRVPEEEHPLVVVLIGQMRENYGAMILRGEHAFGGLIQVLRDDEDARGMTELGDVLSVGFEPMGQIPPELRPLLSQAGFSARRENIAPHLMVKKLGRLPRAPNRTEMRTMSWCLQAILAADDAGLLRPQEPDWKRKRVLELTVSGELSRPTLATGMVPWPAGGPPLPDLLGLDPELARLPESDERWIVCLARVPGAIDGDDRTLHAALVVDLATEMILGNEMVVGEELAPCAALVEKVMREQGERPGELVFTGSSAHDSLAPALSALGVRSAVGEAPAFVTEMLCSMREILGGRPERAPSPVTLADWKEVDRRLTDRLREKTLNDGLVSQRTMARYFGSKEIAEEVVNEMVTLDPLGAYMEWLALDYRPTKRSRTLVEKELAKKRLDPAERIILEARRQAGLSIYRVDSTQAGATLEVEDILSGERHVVHDRRLSGCGLEGYFVPLRLMRVGEWTFPCFGGPPIPAVHVHRVFSYLEGLGVTLSKDGLRDERFGRSWHWLLRITHAVPKLTNTDGDPLELRTATFSVGDPGQLVEALAGRKDVRQEEAGTWIWTRPGGPASGLGPNTILGRLALHDQELLVEVNSVHRLERIRSWLERIPGMAFVRERVHELDAEALPLDDRLPGPPEKPLSPDALADVTRQFHAMCRGWLDEKVPALGNKTPRVACKTREGRERVARIVRTMAPMQVPGGVIPVPRTELLRELGIDNPAGAV